MTFEWVTFQWICLEWYTTTSPVYYWFAIYSPHHFAKSLQTINMWVGILSWLIYEIIVKSDNLIFLNNLVSKYNRYWIEKRIIIYTHKPLSRWDKMLIFYYYFFELFSIDLWKMLCLKLSITSRGIIIFAHHNNLIDGLARISTFFLNQNVWAHLHVICGF